MNIWSLRAIFSDFYSYFNIMKNTISLNRNEQFLNVYKKGKRSYHKYFTMYYIPNGLEFNRLGFKVSKKLAKAVKRNRIRRLLREGYRLSESNLKSGYDIILAAREGALEVSDFSYIKSVCDKLFANAGLFKEQKITDTEKI